MAESLGLKVGRFRGCKWFIGLREIRAFISVRGFAGLGFRVLDLDTRLSPYRGGCRHRPGLGFGD